MAADGGSSVSVALPGAKWHKVALSPDLVNVADLKRKLWTGLAGLSEPEIGGQLANARARAAAAEGIRAAELRGVTVQASPGLAVRVPLPGPPCALRAADALAVILVAVSDYDRACAAGDAARRFRLAIKETRTLLADDVDINGALGAPGEAQRSLLLLTAEQAAAMHAARAAGAPQPDGYPVYVALGVAGSCKKLLRLVVSPAHTVGRLRRMIAVKHAAAAALAAAGVEAPAFAELPEAPMRLLHASQWLLNDDATLASVGVVRGSTVVVAGRAASATAADSLPLRVFTADAATRGISEEDALCGRGGGGGVGGHAAESPPVAAELPDVSLSMPVATLRSLIARAVSIPAARLELRLGDVGMLLRDGDAHGACLLDYSAHARAGALLVAVRARSDGEAEPRADACGTVTLVAVGGAAGEGGDGDVRIRVAVHGSDTVALALRKLHDSVATVPATHLPLVGACLSLDGKASWLTAPFRRVCELGHASGDARLWAMRGWNSAGKRPTAEACISSLLHRVPPPPPGCTDASRVEAFELTLARELALVARYGHACDVPASEFRCVPPPAAARASKRGDALPDGTELRALESWAVVRILSREDPPPRPAGEHALEVSVEPPQGRSTWTALVGRGDSEVAFMLQLADKAYCYNDMWTATRLADGSPPRDLNIQIGGQPRVSAPFSHSTTLFDLGIEYSRRVRIAMSLRGGMMHAISGRAGYDEFALSPDTDDAAEGAAVSIADALRGGGGGGSGGGGADDVSEALEF